MNELSILLIIRISVILLLSQFNDTNSTIQDMDYTWGGSPDQINWPL